MNPTPELLDSMFHERVRCARHLSPETKFLAGGELFDDVCDRMRAGVRRQWPDAGDAEIQAALLARLRRLRQLGEVGLYQPAEGGDEQ